MDVKTLIDRLNEDRELEHRSIVQYVLHVATLKGAKYQSTLNELQAHIGQEVQHALTLARQIDFLGGVPSTAVPAVPRHTDPRAALLDDYDLENQQLERYRQRVAEAEELGLPDVAGALAPLLEQTQEHTRDLLAALG